ncbi:MAG: hypothetical protein COB67_11330 [SAR324 cluster bacterium]|uniref:FecR protein domain-containing protein n=1 Tax=SAR324 cluster bacterium TaxID=2024889 RepID=A0A2A4STQ6_9DELT|nr:MAG: hypothetical protein COB67_11330 [SAR324 cluster bacterium]
MKKLLIGIGTLLLLLETSFGLVKYGEAYIQKGNLTIIRDGKLYRYASQEEAIEILKNDILRVGKNSLVKLETVQDTHIQMGSNAVFQVRAWKEGRKKGYLRMLFGKSRFKTTRSRTKRRRFSVKTAMAVVGVKGTEWDQQTTSNGVSDTVVRDGIVGVTPHFGKQITLGPGERSVVVSPTKATKLIKVKKIKKEISEEPLEEAPTDTEEVLVEKEKDVVEEEVATEIEGGVTEDISAEKEEAPSVIQEEKSMEVPEKETLEAIELDSPAPTSEEAASLDNEQLYIDAGVVDQTTFEQSKQETVSVEESLDEIDEGIEEQEEEEESTEEQKEEKKSTEEQKEEKKSTEEPLEEESKEILLTGESEEEVEADFEEDLSSSEEVETVETEPDFTPEISIPEEETEIEHPELDDIDDIVEEETETAIQESLKSIGKIKVKFEK